MLMKAVRTSETSVNIYQATRRNNPDDSNLHTRRRENLKSHLGHNVFMELALYARLSWQICLN
jgi:hypothetical protein